jgi:hypothetical protein
MVSDMTFRAAAAFQLVNSFMRLPRDSRRVGTGHDWAQGWHGHGFIRETWHGEKLFHRYSDLVAPET